MPYEYLRCDPREVPLETYEAGKKALAFARKHLELSLRLEWFREPKDDDPCDAFFMNTAKLLKKAAVVPDTQVGLVTNPFRPFIGQYHNMDGERDALYIAREQSPEEAAKTVLHEAFHVHQHSKNPAINCLTPGAEAEAEAFACEHFKTALEEKLAEGDTLDRWEKLSPAEEKLVRARFHYRRLLEEERERKALAQSQADIEKIWEIYFKGECARLNEGLRMERKMQWLCQKAELDMKRDSLGVPLEEEDEEEEIEEEDEEVEALVKAEPAGDNGDSLDDDSQVD